MPKAPKAYAIFLYDVQAQAFAQTPIVQVVGFSAAVDRAEQWPFWKICEMTRDEVSRFNLIHPVADRLPELS